MAGLAETWPSHAPAPYSHQSLYTSYYKDDSNYTQGTFSSATMLEWQMVCHFVLGLMILLQRDVANIQHYLQPFPFNLKTVNIIVFNIFITFIIVIITFRKIIINNNPSQNDKYFHLIHIFNFLEAATWASVLKTTGSENFKTVLTFEIWPSRSWDNWG